jgi:hypothetical protein
MGLSSATGARIRWTPVDGHLAKLLTRVLARAARVPVPSRVEADTPFGI